MKVIETGSVVSFVKRHYKTLMPFLNSERAINMLVALLHMYLRSMVLSSKPFIYRIDPCTACNLHCPGCESHSMVTTEKRMLTLKDFKSIVDKVDRYCLRISLYDTGEPLMNKNIYNMISYASKKNISTNISTNLNLFNAKRDLDQLFDSCLTVLQPDLDGFTQETYRQYRIGGDIS